MDDFQIGGIRQNVTESLKITVTHLIALGPMLQVDDTELVRSEGLGVAAAT